MYILLVDDEVAIYHQKTNQSQQTVEQTEVIQEVVIPEVSKLNHSLMNKIKKIKYRFFRKKRLYVEKERWIYHFSTHHTGRWIVL